MAVDHQVNQLILEVTQRCNLECPHCLRGEPRNVDMSDEIIRSVFKVISHAQSLQFTGGEPLLVPHVLERIWKIAEEEEFTWDSFWMSTNGTMLVPENFALLLKFLSAGLEEPFGIGGIQISVTDFHYNGGAVLPHPFDRVEFGPAIRAPNRERVVERFPFISFAGVARAGEGLIAEGRGIDMGGEQCPGAFDDGSLFISADGKVLPFCDVSFESQEFCKIGNVSGLRGILDNIEEISEGVGAGQGPFGLFEFEKDRRDAEDEEE